MKRYYLADLVGDGTQENAYRPAVALENVNWSAVGWPSDETTGAPLRAWTLVIVGAANHGPVGARRGVDPLPVLALNESLPAAARAALQAVLARRGVTVSIDGDFSSTLRGIGRQVDPKFDEAALDCADDA